MKVISFFLLLMASLLRPTHARCARGWWLAEGVRASGEYACTTLPPEPIGDRDVAAVSAGVHAKIYCTGGRSAITVNGVDVGCQPGGWE